MEKQNMIDTLYTTGTAAVGVGGVELIHNVPAIGATGEIIKYVCQAVIALVAVIGMIKKNKRKKKAIELEK